MSATLPTPVRVTDRPRKALRSRGQSVWPVLLVVLLAGTAMVMLYLSRGLTFNLDEWLWVTDRTGLGAGTLLEPHNNHLSLVPVAIFGAMLEIAGLDRQWVMMLPLIALQLTLGALLFIIARRRVGPAVAVGVAALAMVSGLAFENFMVPGQMAQMLSIVAGVAAFALLDRPATRRTDVALAGLVALALASSGLGIPVVVGVGIELLLTRSGRRRLWVVGAPLAVYLLWYLAYGTSEAGLEDPKAAAWWAWMAASHGAGAVIGARMLEPGQIALLVFGAVVVWRFWRGDPAARARLGGLAALLASFYVLTALSRYDLAPASSSRYLTVGLVFMLLLLVEAFRGARVPRWAPVGVLVVVVAATGGHLDGFREGRATLQGRSHQVKGALGAMDLLGPARVAPELEFVPEAAPLLRAGPWFAARERLGGDPGYSAKELAAAPPDARATADRALLRAGGLRAEPTSRSTGACRSLATAAPLVVSPEGLLLETTGTTEGAVRVRRFGDAWIPAPSLSPTTGRPVVVRASPDAAAAPYVVDVPDAVRACRPSAA